MRSLGQPCQWDMAVDMADMVVDMADMAVGTVDTAVDMGMADTVADMAVGTVDTGADMGRRIGGGYGHGCGRGYY